MFNRHSLGSVSIALLLFAVPPAWSADPAFKFFRWDEDYRALSGVQDLSFYDRLKFTELTDSMYLSFGGGIRERLNYYQNDLFGLTTNNDGNLLLSRLLVHGDLHLNENARLFVELGGHYTREDGIAPGPFDEDEVDVTQAFVDLSASNTTVRLGRQEMSLGSTRLVGVRDGPNVRRAFDGVRIDSSWKAVDLRLFALQEVRVLDGSWDNESNAGEELWGAYGSLESSISRFDIYYLGLNRDAASYAQGRADETRHSFGVRAYGQRGAWDWDYEAIYQGGSFGDADIRAWTAATVTGFSLDELPWKPRLALSANIASGDDDLEDGTLGTFNPLYPNLMYFEEAAILAPQNFTNLEPEITVYPSDRLSISFDWDFFWRLEREDAVYVRGLRPLTGTQGTSERFVTHVPSLSIDYEINRYLAVNLSYSRFFAGDVIDDAGGTDIDFLKLEAQLTF
ncbi:MAG: alginate export family protein [Pseudomonadota bacterium]